MARVQRDSGRSGDNDLLPALIKTAVDQLPLPKRMRWGATRDEFTRPVLWLVAMLDEQVLDLTLLIGQQANKRVDIVCTAPSGLKLTILKTTSSF